jgi:hypothetical protein
LNIYNVIGSRVRTLVDGFVGPGQSIVHWDGMDDRNHQVASGVYLYEIIANESKVAKKMVLVR